MCVCMTVCVRACASVCVCAHTDTFSVHFQHILQSMYCIIVNIYVIMVQLSSNRSKLHFHVISVTLNQITCFFYCVCLIKLHVHGFLLCMLNQITCFFL